jgi:hypothetical protein
MFSLNATCTTWPRKTLHFQNAIGQMQLPDSCTLTLAGRQISKSLFFQMFLHVTSARCHELRKWAPHSTTFVCCLLQLTKRKSVTPVRSAFRAQFHAEPTSRVPIDACYTHKAFEGNLLLQKQESWSVFFVWCNCGSSSGFFQKISQIWIHRNSVVLRARERQAMYV